ncbi:cysteine hydrolase family protein [Desulforhopalus sp. IMCC35007]|uniref:cysteine hydrolase family protein n=1 Tax=Desulforhopalus sp. IMCC35007 TaxID=2569543 RepID=UPI0010AE1BF8|nr:cysteine hydrolase family protein [Desulforhopalus sp. IMCC35007]TKB08002.1 cysteine hydrolase [Desulforhopalus sp. IMCC35007]
MKAALLIIDVQNGLFLGNPPAEADVVIDRINELSKKARDAGVPVFFVQHEQAQGELLYGSHGWGLHADLIRADEDLRLRKTTPDAFLGTELEVKLRSLRIDSLIVCGYASEFCVDTTVRRAAALGFAVIIAADAHTTHDKQHLGGLAIREHHNATLTQISSFAVFISAQKTAEINFYSTL